MARTKVQVKKETKFQRKTSSKKAGLIFPVTRILKLLKHGNLAPRIGIGAAVYMAAVLQYLSYEVLDLAGKAALENKKIKIKPRHVMLAIRNDVDLDQLLAGVTISDGGVVPRILPQLLPKKTQKKHRTEMDNISSQEY